MDIEVVKSKRKEMQEIKLRHQLERLTRNMSKDEAEKLCDNAVKNFKDNLRD